MTAFSTRKMVDADWPKIKCFLSSEFRAPNDMGYEFMLWLDRLRVRANVPIVIVGDKRDPSRNVEVGGAVDSAHLDDICDCVDIGKRVRTDDPNWNYSRYKIITSALALGCTRIGMYPGGSLHLDRTEDRRPGERIWIMVDNPAK